MFKVQGTVDIALKSDDEATTGVRMEETVTWDNGRFDNEAFQAFMQERVDAFKANGMKTVTVMMQTVPLDLKHELCAWWICEDFFDRMTLIEGGLETLEPTPEGEVS